jgi:cyclic pyranopterin phosphate synthase
MITDTLGRPLASLRISVTDRCNLRCSYCMPERDYVWLPRAHLLTFQELAAAAAVFAELGVSKLRLTGGEPLVRSELPVLVRMLSEVRGVRDLALTTNGVLLRQHAVALAAAGLQRVTVSLDTLRHDRFRALAGRDRLDEVLAGIAAATAAGFASIKINTVVLRGTNDDEILSLLEYGRRVGAEVRFIEYMDVGGATRWRSEQVFPRREILDLVERRHGPARPIPAGSAPAERFELPDGTVFGVISSTTTPFCRSCDRGRLTADGMLYLCLYARHGLDLRQALRSGASRDELKSLIRSAWRQRDDRGAERRLEELDRKPLVDATELRSDPHLEMHTRGG